MSRKSSDLFDVFNAAAARRAGAARSESRAKSSGAGVVLGRRQLLLAASALVLLMVLSFTVGVGVGRGRRGGAAAPEAPALARTTAPKSWSFRGQLPRVTSDAKDMATLLTKELQRLPALVRLVRVLPLEPDKLEIVVGPFESFDRANDAFAMMSTWTVDGRSPFLYSTLESGR